jgi:site-specific DNA recombinase
MAYEYRRKVRGLIEALNKEEGRAEAGQLIRGLIEKIILVPEDNELKPEIVGDLAGILKLAADPREGKPRRARPIEIEQVKVVAGACSRRYSHPLLIRLSA